jgi:hypothetical protein
LAATGEWHAVQADVHRHYLERSFRLRRTAARAGLRFGDADAVPVDKARIFFYRFYEPYKSLARSPIYLNRREAAVSVRGEVSTLDVAPGEYELYVYSRNDFPNSFKHVALPSRDKLYVRVDVLRNWAGDCFGMANIRFNAGASRAGARRDGGSALQRGAPLLRKGLL